ncbi:UPF0496 protein 4-like [Musa acuminata AAA Group]|uniref:UPF0496 protein 4-like n=1 Tax=Musa acuminata AAA Group TaxID=214697 RepID=UPI0031DFC7E6
MKRASVLKPLPENVSYVLMGLPSCLAAVPYSSRVLISFGSHRKRSPVTYHGTPLGSLEKRPIRRRFRERRASSGRLRKFISTNTFISLWGRVHFLPSPPKTQPASLAHPFEAAFVARLASLLPLPESSGSVALSWLARAVRLLAVTFSDAAVLLTGALSSSDRDALAAYLDSGVALLDACNAASAEIDRLLRRRLHLRFALHLLASSNGGRNPEKLRRARDSVAEWWGSPRRDIKPFTGDLVRPLAPVVPPRGKLSYVRRATYAVEAASGLIAGAVDRVPADFTWADEYHKVAAAVAHKLPGDVSVAEMEAVKAAVRKLAEIIDAIEPNGDGEKAERLQETARETDKATNELRKG